MVGYQAIGTLSQINRLELLTRYFLFAFLLIHEVLKFQIQRCILKLFNNLIVFGKNLFDVFKFFISGLRDQNGIVLIARVFKARDAEGIYNRCLYLLLFSPSF